jgi:hypothetical protein
MTVSISPYGFLQASAGIVANKCQADKLQSLIKAAKIEEVEPIWTTLFAKVRTLL